MDLWYGATCNWSGLCVAMGCDRISLAGALAHAYSIERSSTFYNFAHVQDPNSVSIESIENEFRRRRLPFTVVIPRLSPYEQLEQTLRSRGYVLIRVWGLMKHQRFEGKRNPEVKVIQIDYSRLTEWLSLPGDAGLSAVSARARQEMFGHAMRCESTELLLACVGDMPVGRGLLFVKDGVASIHMMTTVPEFRRRHIATTIVLEALDRLRDEKTELIWLRTRRGGIGEKVYLKSGFDSAFDILTYTRTPDCEDMSPAIMPDGDK